MRQFVSQLTVVGAALLEADTGLVSPLVLAKSVSD
jgi:hypothetical protein